MRPIRLKLSGLTRFSAPVDLDLSELSGLVAVTGPNGAGKTSLLEAMLPGALFRELPSRRQGGMPLADGCPGAAIVDVELEHAGSTWRCLHQFGAPTKSGRRAEALLYRDGAPLCGGRLKDFDDEIVKYFPSRGVVLASAFAVQGGTGSFASLAPAERRELLARILGLDELEALAERSRDARKVCDGIATGLESAHALAVADRGLAESLRGDVLASAGSVADAQTLWDTARGEQAAAEGAVAHAEAAAEETRRAREELTARRAKLVARITELMEACNAADAKREIARAAAERLPALRQAAAEHERLTRERVEIGGRWKLAQAGTAAAQIALDAARATAVRISQDVDRRARLEEGKRKSAGVDELLVAAVARVEEQLGILTIKRAALPAPVDRPPGVADLEAQLVRARAGADLLASVPCGGGRFMVPGTESIGGIEVLDNRDGGACRLLGRARSDAGGVEDLERQIAARTTAEREWIQGEVERKRLGAVLADAEFELRAREAGRSTAQGQADARAALLEAIAALGPVEVPPDLGVLERALETARALEDGELVEGRRLRGALDALGDAPGALATATATAGALDALEASTTRLDADTDLAREEFAGLPEPVAGGDDAVLARLLSIREAARARVRAAEADLAAVRDARARLEGRISQLGDVEARVAGAAARKVGADRKRSGYVLLERGLGLQGVQALEIDAAGPALSELTTELLRALAGPRWAVELRTIREGEIGRKTREVCELLVTDGERGGSRTVDELSGGEQTQVEEALKLAICVYNARRTGGSWGALFRDECDGRLSPDLAARYPEMLRKALDLGGFRVCFYVTHREDLALQADHRLEVSHAGEVRLG